MQSLALHDVTAILDLAGELFTDLGRDYLRRRIAEEGLGAVTFNTWKYDYIFENNQLAWFSHGRLLALSALESAWPRVEPYTDIALDELQGSIEQIVLDDGGFVEGPTYFDTVVRHGGRGLAYYARAREMDLSSVLPDALARTGSFAAAIASTDREQDVISICDGEAELSVETLALLATHCPDTAWTTLLLSHLDRVGRPTGTPLAEGLIEDCSLPTTPPDLPAVVHLSEMRVAASVRDLDGVPVKLFVMGRRAHAGHAHEDTGSFVLEFAGETFAMDPGSARYGTPLSGELKQCQRHNMLVLTGAVDRPAPDNPLPADVAPTVEGDAERFEAWIDATAGWDQYDRWERTWTSPAPGTLRITDEWALADEADADGVTFLWQTERENERTADGVRLHGDRGSVLGCPRIVGRVRTRSSP